MPVDKIRYFPPLGWGITQKGVGEYFEDYPTFVYKADVGGFQEKKSVYIATWVKTAFVTQWWPHFEVWNCHDALPDHDNHCGQVMGVQQMGPNECHHYLDPDIKHFLFCYFLCHPRYLLC